MKYEYKLTNLKKYIAFDMMKDVYTKEEMKSYLDRALQVLDTEAKYKFQQALEENEELRKINKANADNYVKWRDEKTLEFEGIKQKLEKIKARIVLENADDVLLDLMEIIEEQE